MKAVALYFLIFGLLVAVLPILLVVLWLVLVGLWLMRGWRILRWFTSRRQELNSVRKNFGMIRGMLGF